MSQHRAISQLLSLGQESFEDEIRRLVSILIYNFSIALSLFLSNFFFFSNRSKSQIFCVRVLVFNI